jgi:BNR repeat-like domain
MKGEGKMKRTILMIGALGLLAFFLVQSAQAGWTTTQRLTWTAGDSTMPAVAIDSGDGIHIVWQDKTSGIPEVCYKRSLNGGTNWSAIKMLTWNSGASECPAIAADSSNRIHVVWQDDTPGNAEIYYAKSGDRGTTWSAPRRLTWITGSSQNPAIAVDSANRIHVVWQDDKPGVTEIYYKRSTDGGENWSAARRLTWTSGTSAWPALVAGSGASVHLVWTDGTPGNQEIYYGRTTDGGTTWGAVRRLTWTSGECWTSAIAKGSGNALHLVWSRNVSSVEAIYYKKSLDGGGSWSTAKRVTWDEAGGSTPVVAVDSTYTIHIIWREDYSYDEADIFYKKSTNGGTTWTATENLTSGGSPLNGRSYGPAIAINSANTVYFVWYDEPYIDNFEIFYKKTT